MELLTKQQVADRLAALGYDARLEEGVVVVLVPDFDRKTKERLRNILRSVSYRGSWSMRLRRAANAD